MENVIMEPKTDELVDAIAKLIKLTQDGKIAWISQPTDEVFKQFPDEEIGPVFGTIYAGKQLRIYRRRYKYKPSRSPSRVNFAASFWLPGRIRLQDPMPGTWMTETILEIIDDQGVALWTFPNHSMLSDLFSAVQYAAAGVKEFFADVLNEE